jgi:hypothetical protein
MIHAKVSVLALLLCMTAAAGCKENNKRSDEQLKSIEKADRKLMAKEQQILSRRGALQRERTRIRDKRAAILSKKMALEEQDTEGRAQLEQQESELASVEARLVKQEITLNKKLQSLLDEKSGLVQKLSTDKSGGAREMLAARREHSVALREKDLSRREADLARRERELARREQALAVRQAKICPGRGGTVQVVHAAAAPTRGGGGSSRKEVEPVFRAALKAMAAKGILTADLPLGVDRMVGEYRHAVAKKDYSQAKFAADQLLSTVRQMRIDRAFIGAKIGRLSAAIKRTPPKPANRAAVDKLFQEATAAYGDGRFLAANRQLNRIYGKLR